MKVSPIIQALIDAFQTPNPVAKEGHRFSVSRTVSTFAVLYEKARNAVEFRAEHLVRQAAIERILKRRITLETDPYAIAENLVIELLWARYIDSSVIDDATIILISQIIAKYLTVKQQLFSSNAPKYKGLSWTTITGIASAEIDETIISPKKREALVNFVYQSIRPKIAIAHIGEQELNMLTYIAVERSYAGADNALLMFHLLKIMQPDWITIVPTDVEGHMRTFVVTLQHIQENLDNPLTVRMAKFLRKQLPPFLLLRDFLFEQAGNAEKLIDDPAKFEEALTELAQKKYQQIGQRVRRGVIRSIIYIFLTKMLFALALEAPFDIFIAKKLDYIPLAINLMFPPFLLFLLASFIAIPGNENTKKLVERVKMIIYHHDEYQHAADVFAISPKKKRPLMSAFFSLIYVLTFGMSFGVIIYTLTQLHFNIVSQLIFIFFVALVSLFAYRVRQSAKEYEIVERQGIIEPMVDFFFLPILYAGDLLSKEIAKINIFIFLFDFILEAPLKVIFEVVEEWIRFVRTKKEEII